jgi:hypothetical protein
VNSLSNVPPRTLAWNGLRLHHPAHWEATVNAPCHLLFEEDFHPAFEIRWQKNDKNNKQKSRETRLEKIAEESGLETLDSLPPHWKKLSRQYVLKLLAKEKNSDPEAAILLCRECGCTLLLYFFDTGLPKRHAAMNSMLASMRCHEKQGQPSTLWAIQDFQLSLPKDFCLSGHNFGAGLTRLSFTNGSLTMHLCRLAGASERLRNASMLKLLNLLGDLEIPEEELNISGASISHNSSPSILQQIRIRMKRKLPFHRVSLRHHLESDRLSGLFLFDKKPIPATLDSSILDSYEINPL